MDESGNLWGSSHGPDPAPPPPLPSQARATPNASDESAVVEYLPVQMPKTSPLAIASLISACVAFVTCPLVLSIIALILAQKAANDIRASQGWLTGKAYVVIARIVGWIGVVYGIVWVFWFAFFGVIFLAGRR